jgi:uncharacterized membrane protein
VLIAVGVIYLCGLVATTLFGRFFLKLIDAILSRLPVLRQFYIAWKQIALTPGGTEGTFSKVVLIPDETGATATDGFLQRTHDRRRSGNLLRFRPGGAQPGEWPAVLRAQGQVRLHRCPAG